MLQSLIRSFVYSNIFISLCAVVLTYESFLLLHLPASLNWFLVLVFLCTLFVYNLHYFRKTKKNKTDDRLQWCRKHLTFLKILVAGSFVFILGGLLFYFESIFSYNNGFNYNNLFVILLISLLAVGYSLPFIPGSRKSLREIGWLKAGLLSFVWAFTTVVLPAMMQPGINDFYTRHLHLPILFMNRFFFIAALSFLFNINDIKEDQKDGIKTLAAILGERKSLQLGIWSMLIINSLLAWILLIVFELSHWLFFTAAFIPVALLVFLFANFKPSNNEAIFVLKHDGLMMFKSMLLIFAMLILS